MADKKKGAKRRAFDVDNRMDFSEIEESKKKKNVSKAERFSAESTEKKINPVKIFAVIVLVACIVVIIVIVMRYFEAKNNREDLENIYENAVTYNIIREETSVSETEDIPDSDDENDTVTVSETEKVREKLNVTSSAAEFLAINPDTVGYVKIPDVLSEVVVQYTDNEYYLNHNFYNEIRQCGTCFADYRDNVNDYPDRMSDNIILYSHNQKDGTMFGNMDYYRWDLNYWQKNPFIYFSNNYEERTYVIIASFVTNSLAASDDGNLFDYWNYTEFDDENHTFESFEKEITERSQIITGVDFTSDDKFLTLQTCSTEWDDARHVIVARRLRDNETEDSIDTTKLQINPNPKWPAIYYKYHGGSYSETD